MTIEKTRLECTKALGNRSTAIHIPLHIFIFGWITTEHSGVTAQHSIACMSDGVCFTLVSKARKHFGFRLVLLIPPYNVIWNLSVYSMYIQLASQSSC